MLCPRPIKVGEKHVPCGLCIACRVNRKREWVGRLHLEAEYSGPSSFVTLTYNDQFVPKDYALDARDFQRWYDRVRKTSGIGTVRYFMKGEYGDEAGRPHFHVLLFGVPPLPGYIERLHECWSKHSRKGQQFSMGHVDVGLVGAGSIDYVANYAVEKLNGELAKETYGERTRPYTRMSRNPPIGYQGFNAIKNSLYTRSGAVLLAQHGDVPCRYKVNNRIYPVPEYFIKQWREELGIDKPTFTPWEYIVHEASKDRKEAGRRAAKVANNIRRAAIAKKTRKGGPAGPRC